MPNPDITVALDQRLEEALQAANYRVSLNIQKQNAKIRLQNNLIFAINGGAFKVTQELISFVGALLQAGRSEGILLDTNLNPIEILSLSDFLEKILDIYYEAMNAYMTEAKSVSKQRTVKALVGV